MRQQFEMHLKRLEAEHVTGQKNLVELKNIQDTLRGTLPRISSAKALEEELSEDSKVEK